MNDEAIEAMQRQIDEMQDTLRHWRVNGLQKLDTSNLDRHQHHYATAHPTETAANGEIRIVHVGGSDYIEARSNGAWVKVALT